MNNFSSITTSRVLFLYIEATKPTSFLHLENSLNTKINNSTLPSTLNRPQHVSPNFRRIIHQTPCTTLLHHIKEYRNNPLPESFPLHFIALSCRKSRNHLKLKTAGIARQGARAFFCSNSPIASRP